MKNENEENRPKLSLGTADFLVLGGCALVVLAAGIFNSTLGLLVAGCVLIGAGYFIARREPP